MTWDIREEARRREAEMAERARRRTRFTQDLRSLSRLPEGRRFFRWLIDQGGIFAEDFQPGPMGAYRAGQRAMSLRLWRLLRELLPGSDFAGIALGRSPEDSEREADEGGPEWTDGNTIGENHA